MTLPDRLRLIERMATCPGYGTVHGMVQFVKTLKWQLSGKPNPPPHGIKQKILRDLAVENGLTTLVETGTHLGDMIHALRHAFSTIYSIELSSILQQQALSRFKNYNHITILNGDSGSVLHDLVPKLNTPTLFWLDGHYSGGSTALGSDVSPIQNELAAIGKMTAPYVIAIDDARLFGTDPGYPSIEALKHLAHELCSDTITINIESDIIIIRPITRSKSE